MAKNSLQGMELLVVGLSLAATLALSGCGGGKNRIEEFQGVVEFDERHVALEVGGRVQAVEVDRGTTVEPGDRLMELDDSLERPLRQAREAEVRALEAQLRLLRSGSRSEDVRAVAAQLRAAKAAEKLARQNLERQRELVDKKVFGTATLDPLRAQVSRAQGERQALEERLLGLKRGARPQQIQAAEARHEAAQAALEAIDERLSRYALHAPVGGTVLDVHAEAGEVVAPGSPVVSLADTSHPYVDVFVPQGKLEGIRVGAVASVRVDGYEDGLVGQVEKVGRHTEFTPRYLFSERERPNLVVRVRIRIEDPLAELHAGVPARAHIERGSAPELGSSATPSSEEQPSARNAGDVADSPRGTVEPSVRAQRVDSAKPGRSSRETNTRTTTPASAGARRSAGHAG